MTDTQRTGLVQLWSKGYRVSTDTEEFQRYVPLYLVREYALERRIERLKWGSILEPFYSAPEHEFAAQRCLLVDPAEIMSVALAPTQDRHGRPSLVVVTALTKVNWEDADIGAAASLVVALASRLASAYGDVLKGNPEAVGRQLRDNQFLPVRSFSLGEEAADVSFQWPQILAAIRQWRNITGVATARLLPLGANVVLGTKFEAERIQAQPGMQLEVDGFFDVRDNQIRALSSRLSEWQRDDVRQGTLGGRGEVPERGVETLEERLERLERKLDRLLGLVERSGGTTKRGGSGWPW